MYVLGCSGSTHKKVIQLRDSSSFDKRRKGKEKKSSRVPPLFLQLLPNSHRFQQFMKTVFCVFKYALKFFTGWIRWDAFLSFSENVEQTGMPRLSTACGNNTLHVIFMPLSSFFSPPEVKVLWNINRDNAMLKGFKLYIYLLYCSEVPCYIFSICHYYECWPITITIN